MVQLPVLQARGKGKQCHYDNDFYTSHHWSWGEYTGFISSIHLFVRPTTHL